MEALFNILNNSLNLDADIQFKKFFDIDQHRAYVISRNTWGQLFEKGIDSMMRPLGSYRPSTVKRRGGVKRDGTPFSVGDKYTLRDSGDFYNSFVVLSYVGFLEIEADVEKLYDKQVVASPEDVVGLTDESKEELSSYMLDTDFIQNDTLETILRNN